MKKEEDKHGPLHWDELFDSEFAKESDRACVILTGSLLDSALETLLKTLLFPATSGEDPLFDGPNAPLTSFSARIEMAYRLGLIDSGFARCLHLVRRIRNDFAHNITGCTFLDSSILGRLTELRRATGIPENCKGTRKAFPSGPRGDFQMIAGFMQWMLRSLLEDIKTLDGPQYSIYYSLSEKKGRSAHS